jgi:hypothetical protein
MQLRGKLVTSRLLREEEKEEETDYIEIPSLRAANPQAALRAYGLGDPLVSDINLFWSTVHGPTAPWQPVRPRGGSRASVFFKQKKAWVYGKGWQWTL